MAQAHCATTPSLNRHHPVARLTSPRRAARRVRALAALLSVSCSDDKTVPPTLSTLNVTLPLATIQVGQPDSAKVAGVDQHSTSIATGTVTWSSSAPRRSRGFPTRSECY
jgi:hypothetical protein